MSIIFQSLEETHFILNNAKIEVGSEVAGEFTDSVEGKGKGLSLRERVSWLAESTGFMKCKQTEKVQLLKYKICILIT